jgi:hypothetical protein
MTDTTEQEKIFPSQMQNAIFNFLMLLIQQYRQTLSQVEAANKAADWIISLANTIKREAENLNSEYQPLLNDEEPKG